VWSFPSSFYGIGCAKKNLYRFLFFLCAAGFAMIHPSRFPSNSFTITGSIGRAEKKLDRKKNGGWRGKRMKAALRHFGMLTSTGLSAGSATHRSGTKG
jgi:hypothetical protein